MGIARYAYTCLYLLDGCLFWGDASPMSPQAENVTYTHRAEAAAWGLIKAGDGKPPPRYIGPGLEDL